MKVKCLINDLDKEDWDDWYRSVIQNYQRIGPRTLELVIGELYTVYALVVANGEVWYYLADDLFNQTQYPGMYPSRAFEIVDPRCSSYWEVKTWTNGEGDGITFAISEWIREPIFFGNLIDGEPREVEIFSNKKALLDAEFDD